MLENTMGDNHQDELVEEPTDNDVLCGRGGSVNSHKGNERFRTLVEKRKRVYLTARFKREKRLIASSIVSEIRGLNPPGRFLARDTKSGLWKDIGDEKARDKTSQALRENAPSLRAEIETEMSEQRVLQRGPHGKRTESATAQPPPPPPYYGNGWYPPYYSYGHPPPPPGGAPPAYLPPPPHYDPHHPPQHHWGPYPPPYPPKSTLEQTAEIISSGAESIKKWATSGSSVQSRSSAHSSATSKPLTYTINEKKNRMVKFQDESPRPCYSPIQPGGSQDLIEPLHHHHDHEMNHSVMTQFANQILGSFGSWDTSTLCGVQGHEGDDRVPFPTSSKAEEDVDMHVEWEGQEVQLVDRNLESVRSEDRMPPPMPRYNDQTSSIGFSSLGSCSFLPETSYFSWSQPTAMEHSSSGGATENFSANGSIGGNSLTKVFDQHDGMSSVQSPNMSHRNLSQIPSWERSLRSRSPLSIGSDDDASLISKSSSKVSVSSPVTVPEPVVNEMDMVWETKE